MIARLWDRAMKFLGMDSPNHSVMDERRQLRVQRDDAERLARLAQRENTDSLDRLFKLTLDDIGTGRNGPG